MPPHTLLLVECVSDFFFHKAGDDIIQFNDRGNRKQIFFIAERDYIFRPSYCDMFKNMQEYNTETHVSLCNSSKQPNTLQRNALQRSWQEFVAYVSGLFAYVVCVHSTVCMSVGAWATADKNACQSEWASEWTNGAGSGKRAEKETEETERERGLHAVAEEQEQVAVPQEKGGAFFHLLIGDLNWLQIGFSLTEDSPARGVRLSPLM